MTGNWAVLKCCHWASAAARLSLKLSREQKPAPQVEVVVDRKMNGNMSHIAWHKISTRST